MSTQTPIVGNGSTVTNQPSGGDQAAPLMQQLQPVVPLEEAPNDDLITMRNAPGSSSTNAETGNEGTNSGSDEYVLRGATEESLSAAQDALLSTDSNISMQGGRLWQAAAKEAERRGRTMDSTIMPSASQETEGNPRRGGPTGPGSRFAETFMERTRSRADPNALFADPNAKDTTGGTSCAGLVFYYCIRTIFYLFPLVEAKRLPHTVSLLFLFCFPLIQAHSK
jgi:hypothetical protein